MTDGGGKKEISQLEGQDRRGCMWGWGWGGIGGRGAGISLGR